MKGKLYVKKYYSPELKYYTGYAILLLHKFPYIKLVKLISGVQQ